ncbi:MAG: hypothetical protein HKP41_01050 [Desulfobacterales bacterium]|nr:hypothetical protein [Desulfobacterales bacterium]
MKKLFALTLIFAFIVGVTVSPIWAAGGKNQGTTGIGSTSLGDSGKGESPGADAQGNQA